MFDFKYCSDEKRCKYAILRLSKGASLWYEGLKSKRIRAGKDKVTSWESLKRKLRNRYVPATHKLSVYRKIADFVQEKLSIAQYIDEFEKLILMGELEENEEQKMSRFLRGLNSNIANSVELYPYSDFDTLCNLCVKIEAQGKYKSGGSNREYSSPSTNPKPVFSPETVFTPSPNNSTKSKTPESGRETSLSKVRCFKCQGFGHFQSSCPNKRVVTLREARECREELAEEEERLGDVFNFDESGKEEEVVAYEAPNYDVSLVIRSLQAQSEPIRPETEQRDQLFHTKCQVNGKWCSVIIDGGSCTNAASSEMVSKLALPTIAHPIPYSLHWLGDDKKVQVSKQVRICFTMGSYNDEVLCDVVPMDACHILLGRPWQYDRDVTHLGRSNEYALYSNDKKIILKPMSSQAVRTMRSGHKKRSSLAMVVKDEGLESELEKEELEYGNMDPATDFDRPPIFDKYEDDESCEANAKGPCYSLDSVHEFGVFAKTTEITPRPCGVQLHSGVYWINFQVRTDAATLEELSCFHRLFTKETRGKLSMFVHGGWRGGKHKQPWYKELSKLRWSNVLQPGVQGGSFPSSRLLWVFVVQVARLLISVFDPGGLTLRELRSIPFQEGGDDTSKDTGILDEEVILAQSNLTCVLGTNVRAQAVSLLIVGGLDCGNMTLS